MGKSHETWNKKEREQQREKAKKRKEERKQSRKSNAKKGSSLEDMMAYIDENGNISETPPDPKKRKEIRAEDISVGVPRQVAGDPEDTLREGIVTFLNEAKGFGFIQDKKSQRSIFVHVTSCEDPIKERSKVSFEIEMGPKGASAVHVRLLS